ncbi:MAG: dTDP-4-dehydrorhamnose reductase [Afipia sp.]|nr:dTDP-4-dehydrorhamnose reductase [Afipia sp.]
MRILLTGATGQVGLALCRRMSSIGTLIEADRGLVDFTRPEGIEKILYSLSPDLIINAAAYTAVDRAEREPELAHLINAEAPAKLAQWAARNDALIVHFSSDYVFDGSGDQPWCESDKPSPLSVYGQSKLAGELAMRDTNARFLIVRTSWVYSASGNNFFSTIVRLSGEGREMRVVNDQFGAPTSAASIAGALAKIISGDKASIASRFVALGSIVNIANTGVTTWHGFAEAIVGGLKLRRQRVLTDKIAAISSEEYGAPARRPKNSRLDLSHFERIVGAVPPHWKDALGVELDRI